MPATLSPAAYLGRQVIIVTVAGTVYGAAGRLTLQSIDEVGALILALPKGAPCARIPSKDVHTLTPIKEAS